MLSWINIQCFDVSVLIQFDCSFNIETEMEDGGQGSLQHVSVDVFFFFFECSRMSNSHDFHGNLIDFSIFKF